MSQIRRRTVSLPLFGLWEMVHSANPGRPPFVIANELLEDLRSVFYTSMLFGYQWKMVFLPRKPPQKQSSFFDVTLCIRWSVRTAEIIE